MALLILSFAVGLALSLQTAINRQLSVQLSSSLHAALISFSVGTALLFLLVLIQPSSLRSWQSLTQMPYYLWFGGALGVYAICVSIYSAPQLGLLSLSGLIIFGQVLMSMCIDHFGWLGSPIYPIQWQRLLGAVLIGIGVLLTFIR